MNKTFLSALLALCLMGCVSPKQLTLFTDTPESAAEPPVPVYTIDPGDEVQIVFTTLLGDGAHPYNSAGTSYVVRNDSTITIPVLGRVHVAGMTTLELSEYLQHQVAGQIKQPIVHVDITSASICVMGEVGATTRLSAKHPIRLIEVLSLVGGPSQYARLDNVLVQRREGGVLKSYRINLKQDNLSQSPCYYLVKGDLLYISPRIAKKVY